MSDFWRVVRLALPYRWVVAVVILCIAVATVVDAGVFPVLAGLILGGLFPTHGDIGKLREVLAHVGLFRRMEAGIGADPLVWLLVLCGAMIATYAVRGAALFGSMYLGQFVAQRVMFSLRERIYSRVLRLSLAFHERHAVGELMSRMTNDVMLIQNMVSTQLADAIGVAITVIVGVGLMLAISWQLTLLALFLVPIMALVIARAGNRMRRAQLNVQQRLASISARIQERLYSIRIIQSFAREQHEEERFAELNTSNVDANLRSVRIVALLGPLVEFIGVLGMVGGIAFAGWQVTRGVLSADDVAAYLFAVQRVGQRFSKIGQINLSVQQALAAARRILEVVDQEPTVRDAPDAVPLPRVRGDVRFRDVSFAYGDGGDEALRGIEVEVQPGEVIALVGPSGAGKTTLVNLLPRFYDPTSGAVEIDGCDLRGVTLKSLRDQTGIVPQETILFGGSIYDNIRYGKMYATPEEVFAAARAANAEEFIRAMPQGYEFDVGERGLRLSGGQRQRIAIARALLKDPAILVLDEATSSLDMESEALVQDALERLMKGRTTFIIAHRLPTVRNADRILVLDEGRIVEHGSHDELVSRGGLYGRLYEMQFRDAPAREQG
ncbi:MAG: ABC transporter ATP-binding protein [Armatimonadota bacterium]|nr:MAG: ABC transporter ATP-binding protein [Armatimonadota bacterium]